MEYLDKDAVQQDLRLFQKHEGKIITDWKRYSSLACAMTCSRLSAIHKWDGRQLLNDSLRSATGRMNLTGMDLTALMRYAQTSDYPPLLMNLRRER